MQAADARGSTRAWLVAGLCLVVPSTGLVVKYARLPGLVAYASVVAMFLFVLGHWGRTRLLAALTERQALWLAITLLAAVAVVVAIVYPIANSGALGGGQRPRRCD